MSAFKWMPVKVLPLKWLCVVVLSSLGITNAAVSDPSSPLSEAQVRELVGSLSFPDEVEVAFEQSQLNPLFKRVSTQSGVMLKSATQGLVMQVTHPRAERRVLHDGAVSLTRQVRNRHTPGERSVTRRMQLDPSRASHLVLLALEALLESDQDVLFAHFEVSALRNSDRWEVQLVPLSPALKQQISRLRFHGEDRQLTRFRSERDDGKGGYSHYLEVRLQTIQPVSAEA